MVLEQDIPQFTAWIGPAFIAYLQAAGFAALAAALLTWLVQAVAYGPLPAGDRVYRGTLAGLADILRPSARRVWALARLAIQESLRRNVLVVLAVFSLPADIKSRAIQTVTTKPVQMAEIVLGRIVGFSVVGTCLLAAMGLAGWAFVVRSVQHTH